jgi:hypothetical protein
MRTQRFHAFIASAWIVLLAGCASSTPVYRLCGFGPDTPPQKLPAECRGKTVTFTSDVAWLDARRFLLARYDGSSSVYRLPNEGEFGPVLTNVFVAPSKAPIGMVTTVSDQLFVTANGADALAVWSNGADGTIALQAAVAYGPHAGPAHSGVFLAGEKNTRLVTGHENGFVLVWSIEAGQLTLLREVDVRSPSPIESPYKLKHVHGVVAGAPGSGTVITGSEDGDLTVLEVESGNILERRRYNPIAQRGINGLASDGAILAVVACAVGSADRNLWLFRIGPRGLEPAGSVNLALDRSRAQVFAFSVLVIGEKTQRKIYATTEEDLLWSAEVDDQGNIGALVYAGLDPDSASALSFSATTGLLIAGGYNPHVLSPIP